MQTVFYVLLALAAIGALAYALYQVTVRQQRMLAEITRLERLTAEVTMSAEALLDEIDQRMARLNQLAAELEIRMVAQLQARADAEAKSEAGAETQSRTEAEGGAEAERASGPEPGPAPEPAQNSDPAPHPSPAPEAAGEPARPVEPEDPPEPESPADRYSDLRQAVWRLADEGKGAVEIAEALGVPRGEVLLLLNLRGKKAVR